MNWTFGLEMALRPAGAQEKFGKRVRDERPGSGLRLKIAFSMKLREGKIHGQPRYPQVSRQRARGGESRRSIAEASGPEFVANLAVKLLVKRFG
jgi:hypothetical protein